MSCQVAFTFDFDAEEVWLAENPVNERRPGVLSQGTYGAKVAVPLILELLDRQEVRATFFTPGRVAERYPERVGQIVAAGHELALHGYTHRSPASLDPVEEEDELVRAKAILEGFGTPVTGYRSPSWEFSPITTKLLAANGVQYSSNFMDDIHPYRHAGTGLVELPVHWMLDDAPHFWFDEATWTKKISSTSEVREIWEAEFLGIRRLGGCAVFTMHPQIIGRPSRLQFLDQFMGFVAGHADVEIATCAELARRVG